MFDSDGSFFTGLAKGDTVHVFLLPTFEKAHYSVVARLSSGDAADCGGPWDIDREHIYGIRLDSEFILKGKARAKENIYKWVLV